MVTDFTIYQWDYLLIPHQLYNNKNDLEEFIEKVNLAKKSLLEWMGLDNEPDITLKEIRKASYLRLNSSDWIKKDGIAKSFSIKRFEDGILFLSATARLGEYKDSSLPLFVLPQTIKESRFYLDTKTIKVAEIIKSKTSLISLVRSISKSSEIKKFIFEFGYLYVPDNIFFIKQESMQKFSTLLHNNIQSLNFSLAKLSYIEQKMKQQSKKLISLESKINQLVQKNQKETKQTLSSLEHTTHTISHFQNRFENGIKDYEEDIYTLEINQKNIVSSLAKLSKENLIQYYLAEFDLKIEQYKANLRYFKLTSSNIGNMQNSLEIMTNIKGAKADRKIDKSIGLLTLVAVIQAFPELSIGVRIVLVATIGIVALILLLVE